MATKLTYDVIIIGAGIVGLASAYQLLMARPELRVAIVEKESAVATHQTGHNSGVIHSGIYYQPGSLKAKNCVKGYDLLVKFAQAHHIPHDICGKVIVASSAEQIPGLAAIFERGQENGLKGLSILDSKEIKDIEPHVEGQQAIWVPQAGIINYRAVADKLAEILRAKGATLHFETKVDQIGLGKPITLSAKGFSAQADTLVNCAGLQSDKIGHLTQREEPIQIIPFRGEYYVLKAEKEYLVNNLIYPVPDPDFPFLGVHFTRMIQGGIEAGPNAVLAFGREGYSRWSVNLPEFGEILAFKGFRRFAKKHWRKGFGELYRSYVKGAFVKKLQDLIPSIRAEDVERGGAGVRAMACAANGSLVDDYHITEKKGVINVWNAPSPAATSSLAIGETVAARILAQRN